MEVGIEAGSEAEAQAEVQVEIGTAMEAEAQAEVQVVTLFGVATAVEVGFGVPVRPKTSRLQWG